MNKAIFYFLILLLSLTILSCQHRKIDSLINSDKRIILTPSLHNDTILFSYHGNIYYVLPFDSIPEPLEEINHLEGEKIFPRFSPDGKKVVFVNRNSQASDLFIYNIKNKDVKQITFSSNTEIPLDWTNDSKSILFTVNEKSISSDLWNLYEISLDSLFPIALKIQGNSASYGPQNSIYYNQFLNMNWWPGYKGGKRNLIWLNNNGHCKKIDGKKQSLIWPMIDHKGHLYCLGDKSGKWNIYKHCYNPFGSVFKRITNYNENIYYPSISTDKKKIIYEQEGRLRIYDIELKNVTDVKLLFHDNANFCIVNKLVPVKEWNEVTLSSDDKTAYFLIRSCVYRSKILNNQVEFDSLWTYSKNNLHSIAVSPGGQYLSYIVDSLSNEVIEILDINSKKVVRRIVDNLFENCRLEWSPVKSSLLWQSKNNGLLIYNLDSGTNKVIFPQTATEIVDYHWSNNGNQVSFESKMENVAKIYYFDLNIDTVSRLCIDSNYYESSPAISCCNYYDLYYLISRANQINLIYSHRNDSTNLIDKIFPIVINGGKISSLSVKRNKIFFLHNDTLKCIDLLSWKVKTIHGKLIKYETYVGDKILAINDEQNLISIDASTLDVSKLKFNPHMVYSQYNLQELSKTTVDYCLHIISTKFSNLKYNSEQIEHLRDYYFNLTNYIKTNLELEILIFRLLGEFNIPRSYYHKMDPLILSTVNTSINDKLGFSFKLNNNKDYIVDKKYSSDVYGFGYFNPNFDQISLIDEGDYIKVINGIKILKNDNIYQYFNKFENDTIILLKPSTNKFYQIIIKNFQSVNNDISIWDKKNRDLVNDLSKGLTAYVSVHTGGDFLTEFNFQMSKGYKNYVVDLRFCGDLKNEVDFLKEFLYIQYIITNRRIESQDLKIVLLVNEYTNSTAEVIAKKFKELRLGKIIGSRTAGQYSLESYFENYELGLAIPTDAYSLDSRGIIPDIIVDNEPDFIYDEAKRDRQLIKAIKELN